MPAGRSGPGVQRLHEFRSWRDASADRPDAGSDAGRYVAGAPAGNRTDAEGHGAGDLHAAAGSVGVMARLADVLAASIVRGWVECGGDNAMGWFEALRDPRLGRAIGALHRAPGRNWTVAELA